MTIELKNKNIIVTGGTRGIGRTMVCELAKAGANVVTCYRQNEAAAMNLRGELDAIGGRHLVIRSDAGVPEEIGSLVAQAAELFETIDGVVSNAGHITHVPFDEIRAQDWQRTVDTNLTGPFLLAQQVLPHMTQGGSIVFVGSRVAQAGLAGAVPYTATKAGLAGLTRSLCKELGPRGIRVNVLAPGVIETEATAAMEAGKRARYESMSALKRLGRAEEIAHAAIFLLSEAAGFVTGETLNADGGV